MGPLPSQNTDPLRSTSANADSGVPRHIRCFCGHYYWDPTLVASGSLIRQAAHQRPARVGFRKGLGCILPAYSSRSGALQPCSEAVASTRSRTSPHPRNDRCSGQWVPRYEVLVRSRRRRRGVPTNAARYHRRRLALSRTSPA